MFQPIMKSAPTILRVQGLADVENEFGVGGFGGSNIKAGHLTVATPAFRCPQWLHPSL